MKFSGLGNELCHNQLDKVAIGIQQRTGSDDLVGLKVDGLASHLETLQGQAGALQEK